jgi:hypothetical protein
LSAQSFVDPAGRIASARERLEASFDDMVRIFTMMKDKVEIAGSASSKSCKELVCEFAVKIAHPSAPKARHLPDESGAAAEVHRTSDKRIIHWDSRRAVADKPNSVAEAIANGISEYQTDVLHRVVGVHLYISSRVDLHVKKTMTPESIEHVVKKGEWRSGVHLPAPIYGKHNPDPCFSRLALNLASSRRHL